MDIVYRPMHLSDIDKVWQLLEVLKIESIGLSFVEIPDKEELQSWLEAENNYFYIADDDENVLGILRALRGSERSTHYSVLLSVATHPDYRNQGIAKELISAGLEDMKKDGINLARAYILSDNITPICALLRLGFTLSGSVFRHHFDEVTKEYVDDLIFHKLLD